MHIEIISPTRNPSVFVNLSRCHCTVIMAHHALNSSCQRVSVIMQVWSLLLAHLAMLSCALPTSNSNDLLVRAEEIGSPYTAIDGQRLTGNEFIPFQTSNTVITSTGNGINQIKDTEFEDYEPYIMTEDAPKSIDIPRGYSIKNDGSGFCKSDHTRCYICISRFFLCFPAERIQKGDRYKLCNTEPIQEQIYCVPDNGDVINSDLIQTIN